MELTARTNKSLRGLAGPGDVRRCGSRLGVARQGFMWRIVHRAGASPAAAFWTVRGRARRVQAGLGGALRCKERLGDALRGEAGHGLAGRVLAGRGKSSLGAALLGKVSLCGDDRRPCGFKTTATIRLGWAWFGMDRHGWVRRVQARLGKALQGQFGTTNTVQQKGV